MTCTSAIDGHGATTAVTHTSSTRYAGSFAPEPKDPACTCLCWGTQKCVGCSYLHAQRQVRQPHEQLRGHFGIHRWTQMHERACGRWVERVTRHGAHELAAFSTPVPSYGWPLPTRVVVHQSIDEGQGPAHCPRDDVRGSGPAGVAVPCGTVGVRQVRTPLPF